MGKPPSGKRQPHWRRNGREVFGAQNRLVGRGLLATALLLGLMAAGLVLSLFGTDFGASRPQVVVAARDIQPGVPIRPEQLKVMDWGGEKPPAGAFNRIDQVAGRILRTPAFAGEQLIENKLAPRTAKGGLATMIAPGSRAISVRVDEVVGVAGFALPGAYIDVLVSAKDANQTPFSRIVLERIRVLAAEQETAADPSTPKVVRAVTLELTPREVEILDLARSVGSLSLALRGEFDNTRGQGRGARLSDLGDKSLAAAPSPTVTTAPVASISAAAGTVASPATPVNSSGTAAGAARGKDPCCARQLGIEEIRGGR